MAYVMTRVSEKVWNSMLPTWRQAAREGTLNPEFIENNQLRPTHIIDIYKMRRGRYKNVRIWLNLHLGTGYRKDLFMTSADNTPINTNLVLYSSYKNILIQEWEQELKKGL